ncbi:G-alpha domain-containing protein [Rhizoctonia solani AG-1 IA]|uniref:G-alpha domain-containing protein n=1 Tax=Thanatephorus cucumeris (strain AG1-IA) TaxID=983506 RepID=L8WNF4_THACA|nr:G-alpha domain-containing protein [Rhizoctonia solani AG-1 IA]
MVSHFQLSFRITSPNPISAFDQMLAEDRRVNRIEDSIQLFKMVCGNKLLGRGEHTAQPTWSIEQRDRRPSVLALRSIRSHGRKEGSLGQGWIPDVNIVLFLNKCDLLKKKLASGIKVSKYVTSYGERPNDYEAHSGVDFRTKFGAIQRDYSVAPRELYVHLTSVTDTRATSAIIHNGERFLLPASDRG